MSGTERIERVLWRVRKNNPGSDIISRDQLTIAIMKECGIDDRTVKRYFHALKTLGWMSVEPDGQLRLTNEDLRG